MALYEHIFRARQDVSQQQVEELTAALTEVLSQGGGKVTKNEYWGLKGLSYRIRKNRRSNNAGPAPSTQIPVSVNTHTGKETYKNQHNRKSASPGLFPFSQFVPPSNLAEASSFEPPDPPGTLAPTTHLLTCFLF